MAPDPSTVDLGPVIAKLDHSLGGQVPCERIEGLLRELLVQRFGDARVTVYLPVFLYRHALEALVAEARAEAGAGAMIRPGPRPH